MRRNEEVARMMHLSRYCAGCGDERLFEPFHAEVVGCPDAADGECLEWGCTVCGEAVIIGLALRQTAGGASASRAA
jgi:hypothetical protein